MHALGRPRLRAPAKSVRLALAALTLYVGWSYLSIAWADSPGDALTGANRTLLFLLVFALSTLLPWTPRTALTALVAALLALGAVEVDALWQLSSGGGLAERFTNGRLLGPTGYFNASVALATMVALAAILLVGGLPRLPAALQGLLLAIATACLELAVLGGSRGWLFTLPVVLLAAVLLAHDRLRTVLVAVPPAAATLVILGRLLGPYREKTNAAALAHAAQSAGHAALLTCAAVLLIGGTAAWATRGLRPPRVVADRRRALGTALAVAVAVLAIAGGLVATHGRPGSFVSRQLDGFVHPGRTVEAGSYFGVVGSGRYDFWRVALGGFAAHPLTGLGQDNFADYYITRRRTNEEPAWVHSFPLRVLAHTGLVGAALMLAFLGALLVALRGRRGRDGLTRTVSGAAAVPLAVWLLHGSVDWFWEVPALSGTALGLAGIAVSLAAAPRAGAPSRGPVSASGRRVPVVAALAVLELATVAVLGFPYLSARLVAHATALENRNPTAALADLRTAARLDPLDSGPGRLAGTIALATGLPAVARERFAQATDREPRGWFGWLGAGLAASAEGDRTTATRDYAVAAALNTRQAVARIALARSRTAHPLTAAEAFRMLVYA